MALVFCTEEELTRFDLLMAKFSELLNEGMRKIVRSINQKSLLENLVLSPTELALMISFHLLQDVTRTFPGVSESYWEYLMGLVSHPNSEPTDGLVKILTGICY